MRAKSLEAVPGSFTCCYETALGPNVAVPSHFDADGRERFLREGYAMGGLSGHPNISISCGWASPQAGSPTW